VSAILVTRSIAAPVEVVFATVSNISELSRALPHIVKVEFLSDVRSGVGTRFRETRLMKGREATTELEVTEFVNNDRIRLVANNYGTVWDTLFTVKPASGGTELTMTMDASTDKLLPRIMNFLIAGTVRKAVEGDLDAVKRFCESR
jgi:uncharacterized protein YndB with AHSA1/START domain